MQSGKLLDNIVPGVESDEGRWVLSLQRWQQAEKVSQ